MVSASEANAAEAFIHSGGAFRMKTVLRLGALLALFGLLLIWGSSGIGGIQGPGAAQAADGNVLRIAVDDPSLSEGHEFSVTYPCGSNSFSLSNSEASGFACAIDGEWTLTVTPSGGQTLTSVDCGNGPTEDPTPGATSTVIDALENISGTSASFTMVDGEDYYCTFSFSPGTSTGPIAIVANPNELPCGGGTTELTATYRDDSGQIVDGVAFWWSTDAGLLEAGPPNTAEAIDGAATLTLSSSVRQAEVFVHVGNKATSVVVKQLCGQVAIAVTADPNVIPCGGTANLTASARDGDGHIVEGLGFHWEIVTEKDDEKVRGLLNVGPPNTADETDAHATLTLTPGMASSTVRAWVGDQTANPGQVTVQQYCPDVVTDGSSATGSIQLSASSQTAGCGEAVFIGARIRDAKKQVPVEGTDVRFLASAGVFQIDAGVTTTYGNEQPSQALTTVSQYNTATNKSGVLNITYLAPLYGGDAVITAASGDQFAKLTIHVACAGAPPAAVASTGGTGGGASCTPIGDGVCIPGNRGVSIRPPSTGDAGLK
jgi:hypothetical protein